MDELVVICSPENLAMTATSPEGGRGGRSRDATRLMDEEGPVFVTHHSGKKHRKMVV